MITRSDGITSVVKPFSNFLCREIIIIKKQDTYLLGAWPIMEQPGITKSVSIAMVSNADSCNPAA